MDWGEARDFTAAAGPWYARDDGGALVMGFKVLPKHLNPIGLCHGGMLATFCDVALAMAAAYAASGPLGLLPTISLSLDYLTPTRDGAWVETRPQVLRQTASVAFVQALLEADGQPCVRADGVFSVPKTSAGPAMGPLLRQLLGVAA